MPVTTGIISPVHMPSSGSGNVPNNEYYYRAALLKRAAAQQVLARFGQTVQMPKNMGRYVFFRRYKPLARATTALTEDSYAGVEISSLNTTQVAAQLREYGSYITYSNLAADLHPDGIIPDEVLDLLSLQMAHTFETLLWADLTGGTQVEYALGATARSGASGVTSVFNLNDLRHAVRVLKAAKAAPHTKMLTGSPNYATKPIEPSYIAFCHTDLEADLRNLSGFTPVAAYGSQMEPLPFEFGSIENVRFITSADLLFSTGNPWIGTGGTAASGVRKDASNNTLVYPIVITGQNSYATVALRGVNATKIVHLPAEKADKSDPLGRKGYYGWRAYWASAITANEWMVRIETGVSDLGGNLSISYDN